MFDFLDIKSIDIIPQDPGVSTELLEKTPNPFVQSQRLSINNNNNNNLIPHNIIPVYQMFDPQRQSNKQTINGSSLNRASSSKLIKITYNNNANNLIKMNKSVQKQINIPAINDKKQVQTLQKNQSFEVNHLKVYSTNKTNPKQFQSPRNLETSQKIICRLQKPIMYQNINKLKSTIIKKDSQSLENNSYKSKIQDISKKTEEVIKMNLILQKKIVDLKQNQKNKDEQNKKLLKKIKELNDIVDSHKKQMIAVQQLSNRNKSRAQIQIHQIKQNYHQTNSILRNQIDQSKKTILKLEESIKRLQNESKAKDKEIQKYKDFFSKFKNGFQLINNNQQTY